MDTKNNSKLTIKYIRDLAQQEGSMPFIFNPETLGKLVFVHDSSWQNHVGFSLFFYLLKLSKLSVFTFLPTRIVIKIRRKEGEKKGRENHYGTKYLD